MGFCPVPDVARLASGAFVPPLSPGFRVGGERRIDRRGGGGSRWRGDFARIRATSSGLRVGKLSIAHSTESSLHAAIAPSSSRTLPGAGCPRCQSGQSARVRGVRNLLWSDHREHLHPDRRGQRRAGVYHGHDRAAGCLGRADGMPGLGDAEIGDLHLAVVRDEDVGGRDIPVYDI